ncbi:TadE/TadG family type IV pilus assembly protein [Brevundimonas sp. R86498]|uniref:TadE/TadG family type IV pilus assembly protein n=1 Tax=Brevundimonas sp. R86498 TaxID=3093845 RepID=UPI0037C79462
MSLIHGLLRDRRGATAVEFAMVAPLLIAVILMVIEGNRFLWTSQAIQEAASHAARCVAIGSPDCDTDVEASAFALQRAATMGITVPASGVAIARNQTCYGVADMSRVNLDLAFNSPIANIVPAFPERVTAEACFPNLG